MLKVRGHLIEFFLPRRRKNVKYIAKSILYLNGIQCKLSIVICTNFAPRPHTKVCPKPGAHDRDVS